MKTNWNNGMEYGFAAIRKMMWITGTWPIQKNDIVCIFRWLIVLIIEVREYSVKE